MVSILNWHSLDYKMFQCMRIWPDLLTKRTLYATTVCEMHVFAGQLLLFLMTVL